MDFTNVYGIWKQIKAYIDSKLSKSVLPNGVYYYTKYGAYMPANQYQNSEKPNIVGIAIYWDGYSFLIGGSYKSDMKYYNSDTSSAYQVLVPCSSSITSNTKMQESVYSIIDTTNALYKGSVEYIKNIGEISSPYSKDNRYVIANVIRKAINDTKTNNKTSGAVVLASCGMNLLMNYYNRVITAMFKAIGVNWNLLKFRSERSGAAHPVITSDFVVGEVYTQDSGTICEYSNMTSESINSKYTYIYNTANLDYFYLNTPPIYDISQSRDTVYSSGWSYDSAEYAYCNTAILIN